MGEFSIYEIRNPVWAAPGVIDVELKHPVHGWIPYTALEHDDDTLAVFMDAQARLGPYVSLGDPAEPPISVNVAESPAPPLTTISKVDLIFALADPDGLNLMSEEDALAAVNAGTLPALFYPFIEHLPAKEQLRAKLEFASAQTVDRSWPVLVAFAESTYGAQAETVLDAIFKLDARED